MLDAIDQSDTDRFLHKALTEAILTWATTEHVRADRIRGVWFEADTARLQRQLGKAVIDYYLSQPGN